MLTFYVKPNNEKFQELRESLKYLNSSTFLNALRIRSFKDRALEVLKEFFPRSQGAGQHLTDGWKAEFNANYASLGFKIYHDKESDSRVRTVLESLNTGSRRYTRVVLKPEKFIGRYAEMTFSRSKFGWITLKKGREVTHKARPGTHYMDKTEEYIRNVMIPELRAHVRERVAARLERIG